MKIFVHFSDLVCCAVAEFYSIRKQKTYHNHFWWFQNKTLAGPSSTSWCPLTKTENTTSSHLSLNLFCNTVPKLCTLVQVKQTYMMELLVLRMISLWDSKRELLSIPWYLMNINEVGMTQKCQISITLVKNLEYSVNGVFTSDISSCMPFILICIQTKVN